MTKKTLLIIDLGGIIYNWSKGAIIKRTNNILKKHGFSNIQKADKLWEKFFDYALIGKMTLSEAYKEWLKKLGFNKKIIEELNYNNKILIRNFTTPKKGVKTVLRKLKKDYKIAILSDSLNTSKEMNRMLRRSGIKCFDKVFTSHDIGYKKPHPKTYKTVLNYFKSKPEDAIFIGHSKEEICGAKRMGINSISLEKNRHSDVFITKISDIIDAIKTIENKT